MTRIVLHIDRLVLRGVAPRDAAGIVQALRAELGHLLAADTGAAFAAQGNAAVRRVPPLTLAPGTDATALGRAVAGRITNPPGGGRP
ncbi:MAG: hypothetical protein QM740_18305 [Acidovorax sp.]